MKQALTIALMLALTSLSGLCAEPVKKVLCTTFPLYGITSNVAKGSADLSIELLLPATMGCPHHYSLTPRDMQKLARADILVINGLGLEEFLETAKRKARSDLSIVKSAKGIDNLIDLHHHGVNPHLFTSPRMRARMAETIASELSKLNPAEKSLYMENTKAYSKQMLKLADDMAAMGKALVNNRIVQPHGVFDYMARDIGLNIVATLQEEGENPSASEMLGLIKTIKDEKPGVIFTEPQYPKKVGATISKETGIPVRELDPVAAGPSDAALDYYESTMRKNMEIILESLGSK